MLKRERGSKWIGEADRQPRRSPLHQRRHYPSPDLDLPSALNIVAVARTHTSQNNIHQYKRVVALSLQHPQLPPHRVRDIECIVGPRARDPIISVHVRDGDLAPRGSVAVSD
jgi:hypothetical protein